MRVDSYRIIRLSNGYLIISGVNLAPDGSIRFIDLDEVEFGSYELDELNEQFRLFAQAFEHPVMDIDPVNNPAIWKLFSEVDEDGKSIFDNDGKVRAELKQTHKTGETS